MPFFVLYLHRMKFYAFILSILVLSSFTTAELPGNAGATPTPSFSISPNPVSGNTFALQFSFSQVQFPNAQLSISNLLGQTIFKYSLKKVDYDNGSVIIDVSETKLEKGVYFVQLKSGEVSKTVKLAIR